MEPHVPALVAEAVAVACAGGSSMAGELPHGSTRRFVSALLYLSSALFACCDLNRRILCCVVDVGVVLRIRV